MSQHDRYISPFSTRYSSDEMQYIFSDDNKFRTWRRLWVALARAEMKQGLTNITPEMVEELEAHVDDINYDVAIAREKLVRHDVMSHVYAYGQQCPKAAGIIHLGATSCYVGDNTDIIVMRQGLSSSAKSSSVYWPSWPVLPRSTRTCPAWPTPTASPLSPPPWASARPCGPMSW